MHAETFGYSSKVWGSRTGNIFRKQALFLWNKKVFLKYFKNFRNKFPTLLNDEAYFVPQQFCYSVTRISGDWSNELGNVCCTVRDFYSRQNFLIWQKLPKTFSTLPINSEKIFCSATVLLQWCAFETRLPGGRMYWETFVAKQSPFSATNCVLI